MQSQQQQYPYPIQHHTFGGYQRQTSQPQAQMGRRANTTGPYSFTGNMTGGGGKSTNFNRAMMNTNSFFSSFSESVNSSSINNNNNNNNNPQPAQQQHVRHKTHFRSTQGKNKTKLLAAPYNTTQYIMHDYSKRKTSSGENMLREQFEHDWAGMQSSLSGATAGDVDMSEQFETPKRENSGGEATSSQSESDLDLPTAGDQQNGCGGGNKRVLDNSDTVAHDDDDDELVSVNRLSTSI